MTKKPVKNDRIEKKNLLKGSNSSYMKRSLALKFKQCKLKCDLIYSIYVFQIRKRLPRITNDVEKHTQKNDRMEKKKPFFLHNYLLKGSNSNYMERSLALKF